MMILKGQSPNFSTFNMSIYAVDGAPVQNLCPVRHFNPKANEFHYFSDQRISTKFCFLQNIKTFKENNAS